MFGGALAATLGIAVFVAYPASADSGKPSLPAPALASQPVQSDQQSTGDITVTIPPVVFGETDRLPAALQVGRHYSALLMVWAPVPDVVVVDVTGTPSDCGDPSRDGSVVRVPCTFTPEQPGDVHLVISVDSPDGKFRQDYRHPVSR